MAERDAVHPLEKGGKQIVPKSLACSTIQRLKPGRRSAGAGCTDVMSPGCQRDGHACISSLDEPVHGSDGDNDDLALGDVLAGRKDDRSQVAVWNTDWKASMAMLHARQRCIAMAMAEGESCMGQAARMGVSPSAITQRCDTTERRARAS